MTGRVAIIGLAGRFPTAPDTATLWRRLVAGDDCVTGRIGHSAHTDDGRWIRDGGVGVPAGFLDGYDRFDAEFFGVSPLEARITDPQHRLLLETVWEALEDAGHGEPAGRRIGVFATASQSGYQWTNVRANSGVLAAIDETQLALGNAPDFLAARVAFKLDLRGPAVTVSAACSSSLVAVHLAGRALLAGECDLAVVAGASVSVSPWCELGPGGAPARPELPQRCRSFSADADFTVSGDGAVAVVLRRLDDAVRNRDGVRAVIRGTAVNNDGGAKMGFSTPTVAGQVEVARAALAAAGVDPGTVGYVEGHGSGTPIGDSIELAALAEAYGPAVAGRPRQLGSVKSNIGYLDGTAGLAGLVKTVLALREELIPGNLHFSAPHQNMAGFTMVTGSVPWPRGDTPRRAGVSSYAMGGTNAHVILEEAPATLEPQHPDRRPVARPYEILTVSARSRAAVDAAAARLTGYLAGDGGTLELDSVAFTLHVGRRAFGYRRTAVVPVTDAATSGQAPGWSVAVEAGAVTGVVFRFPETPPPEAAAATLERQEPAFAAAVADCAAVLRERRGLDASNPAVAAFVTWYAMIRLWRSWGVRPDATTGPGGGRAGGWRLAAAAAEGRVELAEALVRAAAAGPAEPETPPGAARAVEAASPGALVIDLGACLDAQGLAAGLAAVWAAGIPVDWAAYHAGTAARRVPLPTYPFERRRHWVDPDPGVPSRPAAPLGDQALAAWSPETGFGAPVEPDAWDEGVERLLAEGADPIEAVVAGVWQEVLGVASVAAGDDFFTLGGDSLRLLRMTSRLRDLFGLEIPLEEAFTARRFERLIALLEDLAVREPLR